MSKNSNFFNLLLRKYSYGGTIQSLVKGVVLAEGKKKEIRILNININPKRGRFFINNIKNLEIYKILEYEKFNLKIKDIKYYTSLIFALFKILIKKYIFFSLLFKIFFFLRFLNYKKSKDNFSKFINDQDYFDGVYSSLNLNYLKKININFTEGEFQKIYLNRKSFDLKINATEKEFIKNNYDIDLNEKFICYFNREKAYNLKFKDLKKNNNFLWYNRIDFDLSINSIIKDEIKIVDIGSSNKDILEIKNFIKAKYRKNHSEKIDFILAKNCQFFLSTGGGKVELANLFKKPILKVDHEYNIINNFDFSTNKDHIILPNIYSKKKKRFLSLYEQFTNLDKLFPGLKNNLNFKLNYDDFALVKNSQKEINDLYIHHNFCEIELKKNKELQLELFEIKYDFLKKRVPEYFTLLSTNYPENPQICKKFYSNNFEYSDYLDNKTSQFNKNYFNSDLKVLKTSSELT